MSTYFMVRGNMGIEGIAMKLNGFLVKLNENC